MMLVNPRDKTVSIGWDAVRKHWDELPADYSEFKVTQAEGPNIAYKEISHGRSGLLMQSVS